MSRNQSTRGVNPVRIIQRFIVSGFVVCSFMAYVVHQHLVGATDNAPTADAPLPTAPVGQAVPSPTDTAPSAPQSSPSQSATAPQTQATSSTATARPRATATPIPPTAAPAPRTAGAYRDGTYTGPSVNAFWGQVQVQAIVQNGKLANVQVLQYPSDRRTSQRINQQAIPWLQSEVVQAQNANVDIISGATLTSEAFIRSLQAALNSARSS